METNNKPRNNAVLGVLFIGCMFIGMGIGLLMGHLRAGIFIGMGVGFLSSAVLRINNK